MAGDDLRLLVVTDHVLQEDLEDAAGLLVDEAGDPLDAAPPGQADVPSTVLSRARQPSLQSLSLRGHGPVTLRPTTFAEDAFFDVRLFH